MEKAVTCAVGSRPVSALSHNRTYAPQKNDVRFAPNSDRESGHRLAGKTSRSYHQMMSALYLKADMYGAMVYFR